MSDKSGIEWTEATWNPVVGCRPVSAGCANCYAAGMTHRLARMGKAKYLNLTVQGAPVLDSKGRQRRAGKVNWTGRVRTVESSLKIPLKWKKPRRIFVNSMSDLFHEDVPDDFIDRVFETMMRCPQHTFQVLTKRPERMAEYLRVAFSLVPRRSGGHSMLMDNLWLGTSVENQPTADERIPHLMRCPAAVRFLSIEPQIGPIEYRDRWADGLHWMVGGGESGGGARPYDVAWARAGIAFAHRHGIAWFQKQLGSHVVCRNDRVSEWLDECHLSLDGIDVETVRMQGDPVRVRLADPKGGDPAEWPEEWRVRQMPAERKS